jgi:putative membrane protein
MIALRSATRLMPAVLATSLLAGCGWHASHWESQHAGDRSHAAAGKAEPQETVVQAGAPAESSAAPIADKKAERQREETRKKESAEREKSERKDLERAQRARDELARNPENGETEAMRVWRLDQKHIDAMLGSTGDGSMIGLFQMSNDIDLSFAKLAYAHSERADVKAYAQRMMNDHAQMLASIRTMLTEHDIAPLENPLSRALRDRAALQRDSLLVRDGQAFDAAYVALELDYHRELLSLIDDVFLPRAKDGDLREMIATMRPVISAHMAHAEQLQAAVGKR